MSFYGKELEGRLSWRQWNQDMSDKITRNVIDECNTHTMFVAKTFPEEKKNKTKQNRKTETKDQQSLGNFGFNVSFFVSITHHGHQISPRGRDVTKRVDKTLFLIVSFIFALINDVMTLEGVGQHVRRKLVGWKRYDRTFQ